MMDTLQKVYKFQDLKVWEKAHQLTLFIYKNSVFFPKEEMFGLTSQVRRAAASTAANIAEGSKRRSVNDLCHFLNIAQGSNEEVKYFLMLARDLTYLTAESFEEGFRLADEIGAMLHSLIKSLKSDH